MPEPHDASTGEITSHDIKSILLLDDDVELANTLKQLLETHNFVVTTVHNGVDGVREVMRFDFDIIMCDMMMPGMPGDMFYFAVERTKPQLCSRFIFITGHSDKPEVMHFFGGLKDGVVMHKPVTNDNLIRTISLVLKRNGTL
jgi:DNA-binding response OmpR family regulator